MTEDYPKQPDEALVRDLLELHNVACAAAFSLKCIDNMLDLVVETDHCDWTYEDKGGMVYSIQRAIHALDMMVKQHGLQGEFLYPDMKPGSMDDMGRPVKSNG